MRRPLRRLRRPICWVRGHDDWRAFRSAPVLAPGIEPLPDGGGRLALIENGGYVQGRECDRCGRWEVRG